MTIEVTNYEAEEDKPQYTGIRGKIARIKEKFHKKIATLKENKRARLSQEIEDNKLKLENEKLKAGIRKAKGEAPQKNGLIHFAESLRKVSGPGPKKLKKPKRVSTKAGIFGDQDTETNVFGGRPPF